MRIRGRGDHANQPVRSARKASAQRVRFELRHGVDARGAFAGMEFRLCHADGTPYPDGDEDAKLPRGVAWRRGDAILAAEDATFGAHGRKILLL